MSSPIDNELQHQFNDNNAKADMFNTLTLLNLLESVHITHEFIHLQIPSSGGEREARLAHLSLFW